MVLPKVSALAPIDVQMREGNRKERRILFPHVIPAKCLPSPPRTFNGRQNMWANSVFEALGCPFWPSPPAPLPPPLIPRMRGLRAGWSDSILWEYLDPPHAGVEGEG
jgi:hypothetical protein